MNFGGWYGLLREYAWDGKVVWEYKVSNSRQIAHHGFDRLPNGNTAILIWENKTYDEALAKGRDPKDKALSRNGMPAPGQGPDGQPLQGIWPEDVYKRQVEGRGTQFDPLVVEAFLFEEDAFRSLIVTYPDDENPLLVSND